MKFWMALLLLGSATLGAAHATPEVALLTDLQGRVEMRHTADQAWDAAYLDQRLSIQNDVRTWQRSNAELRFVDGSVLMLSEQTRLKITTALFDARQAPPEVRVALAAGGVDIRTGSSPLTVTAGSGATHIIGPRQKAHVRLIGEGTRASLVAGPARMLSTVDVADEAGLAPTSPIVGEDGDADASARQFQPIDTFVRLPRARPPGLSPSDVTPEPEAMPEPGVMEPDVVEPEVMVQPEPAPPEARVRITVRAGGDQ